MISWMQKHRKYLVVTIWISTIAFVGAGFVGWGAYSFSDASNAVAKVGDVKISIKDYQREYSNMFGMYQQLFNGSFDEAKAKEMKLEELSLERLISKAYMLNMAKDFGIYITDVEVAQELAKIKDFQKDGKFDKATYIDVLKNSRLKPNDFETTLKDDLMLRKFYTAIKPSVGGGEKDAVLSAFFMKDALKISIVHSKDVKVVYKDEELKKFWETNKNKYMTNEVFELDIHKTPLINSTISEDDIKKYYEDNKSNFVADDGKILSYENAKNSVTREIVVNNTKKEANKNFYKFKSNELLPTQSITTDLASLKYDGENTAKLMEANVGDVLKPMEVEDGFVVIKIKNKIPSKEKTYEEAIAEVKKDFEIDKKTKILEENAKEKLKNFDGIDIGSVSRNNIPAINGLTQNEANVFVNKVFSKNTKKDFVILGDKVVIYEIISQSISKDSEIDDMFNENIVNIKEALLDRNLMKLLTEKYQVEKYVK